MFRPVNEPLRWTYVALFSAIALVLAWLVAWVARNLTDRYQLGRALYTASVGVRLTPDGIQRSDHAAGQGTPVVTTDDFEPVADRGTQSQFSARGLNFKRSGPWWWPWKPYRAVAVTPGGAVATVKVALDKNVAAPVLRDRTRCSDELLADAARVRLGIVGAGECRGPDRCSSGGPRQPRCVRQPSGTGRQVERRPAVRVGRWDRMGGRPHGATRLARSARSCGFEAQVGFAAWPPAGDIWACDQPRRLPAPWGQTPGRPRRRQTSSPVVSRLPARCRHRRLRRPVPSGGRSPRTLHQRHRVSPPRVPPPDYF